MRPVLPAAVIAAALAILPPAAIPVAAQEATPTTRQVTVVGAAEVEAAPDRATVSAGVDTQSETAAEALAAHSAAMTRVFAALEAAGIDRRDMQTSNLQLGAVWEPYRDGEQPPRVIGYQASNMVTVRVRDVTAVGAVVDAVATAGANRLNGVGFELSDPRAALDKAREQAVADARARAELYAGAAGVTLGPVLAISEVTAPAQPFFARAADTMQAAPPVAEGTVALRAEVRMVFALE
jgi:uncharacterized protein YggE